MARLKVPKLLCKRKWKLFGCVKLVDFVISENLSESSRVIYNFHTNRRAFS